MSALIRFCALQDDGHLLETQSQASRADSLFGSVVLLGQPGGSGTAGAAGARGSGQQESGALRARLESLERELEDRWVVRWLAASAGVVEFV